MSFLFIAKPMGKYTTVYTSRRTGRVYFMARQPGDDVACCSDGFLSVGRRLSVFKRMEHDDRFYW